MRYQMTLFKELNLSTQMDFLMLHYALLSFPKVFFFIQNRFIDNVLPQNFSQEFASLKSGVGVGLQLFSLRGEREQERFQEEIENGEFPPPMPHIVEEVWNDFSLLCLFLIFF